MNDSPELVAQAARHLHTRRGPNSQPVAATTWRCEGRWQAEDQMDIWQCCDEAERDAMRERGELDDEEETDDGHDQA